MVTDFDISTAKITQVNTKCGTFSYEAPKLKEELPYDKTVDWWALGIVLWELLAHTRHEGRVINLSTHKFSEEAKHLLQSLQQVESKRRLGHGDNGTKDIKNLKIFGKKFWHAYDLAYQNTPEPSEQEIDKMIENFDKGYINLQLKEDMSYSFFNYNINRTAPRPQLKSRH